MKKLSPIVKTYKIPKHWIMEKRKEITLHIPNVRYAKENELLLKKRGITQEMIKHNMELCGFDIVSCGEHKDGQTKIVTKCCNIDCEGTTEKQYQFYIASENIPVCKSCSSIVRSLNTTKTRRIVAIKNDEKIEFASINEASEQLNITYKIIYNHLKSGTPYKSCYSFKYSD
ncbi:TPA: hypothetical protein ACGW7B_005661 [Bacillus nitratireducens]|nr:hypothetical protein BC2926_26300 [Bacillus cereus]